MIRKLMSIFGYKKVIEATGYLDIYGEHSRCGTVVTAPIDSGDVGIHKAFGDVRKANSVSIWVITDRLNKYIKK